MSIKNNRTLTPALRLWLWVMKLKRFEATSRKGFNILLLLPPPIPPLPPAQASRHTPQLTHPDAPRLVLLPPLAFCTGPGRRTRGPASAVPCSTRGRTARWRRRRKSNYSYAAADHDGVMENGLCCLGVRETDMLGRGCVCENHTQALSVWLSFRSSLSFCLFLS